MKLLRIAPILLGCCAPILLWSWGSDGHRLIARLAVKSLPERMPRFFLAADGQLQFLATEPDQWRMREESKMSNALRAGTDPDHFFEPELFPAPLPPDRYQYLQALEKLKADPTHVGMLPYRAVELFQRMRINWRRWRAATDLETRMYLEARIIEDSGLLAHYIGDGSQPQHASANYNGWRTTPNPNQYTTDNTIHWRFESDFVVAHIRDRDVQPLLRPVALVENPLKGIEEHLHRAANKVEDLYKLDKSQAFGSGEADSTHIAFVAERLADGASFLRDLWWTAYETSASDTSAAKQ